MALDFGKLNFSTSFNPTSAFPLDARTYFESLSAAQQAAATAVEVGGSASKYYIGQMLTVYENAVVSIYTIQPDGSLKQSDASPLKVNNKVFDLNNVAGELNLLGFEEALPNTVLTKNGDGSVSWNTITDAYSKEETEEAIAKALATAAHLRRKIVDSVDDIYLYADSHTDAEQYIFMVPTGLEFDDDKYDEYIVLVTKDSDGIETSFVEKVGSWEVNLDDYVKITELEDLLNGKVDKDSNARLITLTEVAKLDTIEEGAQVNIIDSVSSDFKVINKELTLESIDVDKINGLENLLNNKVDKKPGYDLISDSDKAKLDALVLNNGNIEISGKVNASNVQDLDVWISERAGTLPGLSENNLSDELFNKLEQSLFIKEVDSTELQVTGNVLSIKAVAPEKVVGLVDTLNSLATTSQVETLQVKIDNLATSLNNYVDKTTYTQEINEIRDILTWKDM